ncbi:hypothetical protein SR882_10905 [Guyparkeria halophila]|uniref:Uncharacterized protein n=1 Tax=Guyparkeria halophila TaxID=47960 RepID=A0ABZ0YXF5_9GAMM|nr:hypothetical protein [Guyparkeria halophila]WQH16254.1 hypothetical protein SR882_10905 [Guyparkeria halophila]
MAGRNHCTPRKLHDKPKNQKQSWPNIGLPSDRDERIQLSKDISPLKENGDFAKQAVALGVLSAASMPQRFMNINGDAPTRVELQNHADDFFGSIIGGNQATYDQRPEGSSRLEEWAKAFGGAPTVHSCYGNGAISPKCEPNYGPPKTKQILP